MRDSFQSGFVVRFSMAFVSVGLTVLMGCANTASSGAHEPTEKAVSTSESHVVLRSEVEWSPLNPARGDASPQAGTLWGDRAGQQAASW